MAQGMNPCLPFIDMRILITADPYLPVPPRLYGGIERVVDLLVRGLVSRGHELTLVAHPESKVPARLVPYGRPPHVGAVPRATELAQVSAALWHRRDSVDVVHSFGRLAALLPILPLRRMPKIQSYQRDSVPWPSIARAARLGGPSICFTGCSTSVYRLRPNGSAGRWLTIFNGVDLSKYEYRASIAPEAPLAFLGRLEPMKGAHHAIEIARAAGRRLVIAGNRVSAPEAARYFDDQIAPHLDGAQVTYVGEVDDGQKSRLLGESAALLMPIDWEEPFGIVMTEALACGTPVIAFGRGSVPEIVRDGVNGFICDSIEGAVRAVRRLKALDRAAVRADCEIRFDAPVIVEQYERLYRDMLASVA
jgi:glycosyltransferase involved in cell wall biosynthesis